jgi:formylglycine-generating enzyme required for sulfatase activity
MVFIPAGRFTMGSADGDVDAQFFEKPAHKVVLSSPFYMDAYEVTRERWARFTSATRTADFSVSVSDAQQPIVLVDLKAVRSYCEWAGVQLPTEAQWEYCARSGSSGLVYPWGNKDAPRLRNGRGDLDGFSAEAPVGSFPSNEWGLFDMIGNVSEICRDEWSPIFYAKSPGEDPYNPTLESSVVRGGSYEDDPAGLRIARRDRLDVGSRGFSCGFRCVKDM